MAMKVVAASTGECDDSTSAAEMTSPADVDVFRLLQSVERVIHPRKAKMSGASNTSNDTPITLEMAIALRTVVFGNSTALSRPEWYRGEVALREPEKPLAFGLLSPRNVLKPVTACVQAHLIKQLLFEKRHLVAHQHRPVSTDTLLQPNRMRQSEALAGALADIFWRCGERKSATIVLPSEDVHIKECSTYVKDGVTELLTIHDFKKLDQLTQFLKRHLSSSLQGTDATVGVQIKSGLILLSFDPYSLQFTSENSPGHLLVLYGAVLSRGTSKVKADLQGFGNSLLTSQGEYTIPLLTLLLIGQATPFLHNGSVLTDSDENNYGKTKLGITCRGDIGILQFKRAAETSWEVGSRLKTPYYPIWVTIVNENFGVLFSSSRDLVRDYHAERNFVLHYVNMSVNQLQPTALTIDTRFPKQQQSAEDLLNMPPLELLISTKWHSAEVGWNNITPFV